jgi:hypothetical protein
MYTTTTFLSSSLGYVFSGVFYTEDHKRTFFTALFFTTAGVTVLYLVLEGYNGFVYPCKRQRTLTGKPPMKLVESRESDKEGKFNESLFGDSDLDIQKEQYINCEIFYGKYFTGDVFAANTPFIFAN